MSSKEQEVSWTEILAQKTLRCVVGSEQTHAFVSWERKLIAFPSERLSHPLWTNRKDRLKRCLLIREWLDYFYLPCEGKYKSRRIAVYWGWILLYCLISVKDICSEQSDDPKRTPSAVPLNARATRTYLSSVTSESVRTDSWLGWYPVETVLRSPLSWQEPPGQKSLFLVLFQREHISENTIKAPPLSPQPTWL